MSPFITGLCDLDIDQYMSEHGDLFCWLIEGLGDKAIMVKRHQSCLGTFLVSCH